MNTRLDHQWLSLHVYPQRSARGLSEKRRLEKLLSFQGKMHLEDKRKEIKALEMQELTI